MGKIFRWPLNHKFKAILALLLLVLVMRLVWGWSVHRELQSRLSAIRARGEPINASEVVHQAVPDEDNAVLVYRKAISALNERVDCPRNSNLEYPDYFPRPPKWMALAEASEKAQSSVFPLVRSARQRQRAQFATSFSEQAELRYLGQLRDLANVINDGAEYSHLRGNDAEAIERLLDSLHLSRALAADDYLVSYLVAIGIDASTCHSIMLIASDLSAAPENIRSLIDQLLDEKAHRDALKRTLINERVRQIHSYVRSSRDHWVLAPLADRDLIRELPNLELILHAADCPDFAQAQKFLQRCQWDIPPQSTRFVIFPSPTMIPRYSRWFYDSVDFSPQVERCYRVLAERRLTAISLACRLYRDEHGQFPQNLQQLVPKYLPAIPTDPFFSDGRPIGYAIKTHTAPLSGRRPVLYFDPGGGDIVLKPEPLYDWYVLPIGGASVRQYRDISRFAPASAKAVNNNPNQPNAPGQDSQEKKGFQEP
ncbi:MAG TPA: hypothetical protein VGP99_05480 [Tepidisphaeraceae bacterium]|nr:hypothetical protein [Tepidisphaeraceae bacterium]